jgi:hypothetical protein
MTPAADGTAAQDEGPGFVIILALEEGQITERWATFLSWGE